MTDQAHGQGLNAQHLADAMESVDWSNVSIGNKCMILGAIELLRGPSLPAPGREVKLLDWQETFTDRGDGSSDQTGWEANSGFEHWYSVEQYFASDSYGWRVTFDCSTIADCDDPDKAKAAAQADYEKRIRAALSPSSTAGDSDSAPHITVECISGEASNAENVAWAGQFEVVNFNGRLVTWVEIEAAVKQRNNRLRTPIASDTEAERRSTLAQNLQGEQAITDSVRVKSNMPENPGP